MIALSWQSTNDVGMGVACIIIFFLGGLKSVGPSLGTGGPLK